MWGRSVSSTGALCAFALENQLVESGNGTSSGNGPSDAVVSMGCNPQPDMAALESCSIGYLGAHWRIRSNRFAVSPP